MKKKNAFRRAAALMAALSITVSLAAPAFAATYYIDDGDITITKDEDGKQTVQQGSDEAVDIGDDEEIIITTRDQTPATQESDLEGPAAEDSGFGPVVEDNYQPAQPEDADQPESADQPENTDRSEDADQPESAEEPKSADQPENTDRQEDADQLESAEEPKAADRQESADQQAQPQQAAPADAAPAAPTSVNGKGNGVFGNIITVINNAATALKLTLKDVKIDVSDTGEYGEYGTSKKGNAALSVQGNGDVEIELDGKNELKSGILRAGLEKNSTGTLTLKDDNQKDDNQKAGSLTATGSYDGAGIGGGDGGLNDDIFRGNGENITINGGTVNATGGGAGAGIGGGGDCDGKNITINGGTVNAAGGAFGAGIGGGREGKGSNVTVSGAAQVTATASKSNRYYYGAGATIGNGGDRTGGETVDGEEIQADISGVTTGYIHHIIYDPDLISEDNPDGIVREWWEPERPQPNPEDTDALTEESNEVDLGAPGLHVETLEGDLLPFDAQQQGSTLRVTSDNLSARFHGTRQTLEALREQGVEQIEFVTTLKTTTLSVEDLLAEGGSWFALEHGGLVSRQLSAAQAESLKCRMH